MRLPFTWSILTTSVASSFTPLPIRQAFRRPLATIVSSSFSSSMDHNQLQSFLSNSSKCLKQAATTISSPSPVFELVMGNQAADADSIISSVCLSYLTQSKRRSNGAATVEDGGPDDDDDDDESPVIPIIPISRSEMSLRPETLLLFKRAGVVPSDLVHIDEVDLEGLANQGSIRLTLVDHNRLAEPVQYLEKSVGRIVDHHEDQGMYPWVKGEDREVAFESQGSDGVGVATVASCCTLVAERFLSQAPMLLDSTICTLLLGVIMLDAAGLDTKAGKVMPRDLIVVEALETKLAQTRGEEIPLVTTKEDLYTALSEAKFDRDWWLSLSIQDALRLDYKAWTIAGNPSSYTYGISSVLVPVQDLLNGEGVAEALDTFAKDLGLLVIMSLTKTPENNLHREIVFYARDKGSIASFMNQFLASSEGEALELRPLQGILTSGLADAASDQIFCFQQGNIKASRKQVEPIIRRVLMEIL